VILLNLPVETAGIMPILNFMIIGKMIQSRDTQIYANSMAISGSTFFTNNGDNAANFANKFFKKNFKTLSFN
jgi:hypothetical protein